MIKFRLYILILPAFVQMVISVGNRSRKSSVDGFSSFFSTISSTVTNFGSDMSAMDGFIKYLDNPVPLHIFKEHMETFTEILVRLKRGTTLDHMNKVLIIADRVDRNIHGQFAIFGEFAREWDQQVIPLVHECYSTNETIITIIPSKILGGHMHVPASAVSTTTVDPSHNKYVTRAKAAIQKEDTSTFDNASAPTNNREDEKHYLINFLTEDLCDALLQMLSTAIFEAKFPANKRVEPVVIKNIETIVTIASNICNYDNTKSAEFTKRLGAFYSYYKLELKKVESFPNGTVVVTTVQQIQPDNPSPLNMAAISGDGVSDAANPMALPYNSHLVQTIADGPHTHATPQIPTTLHPQHHIQPPGAPQLQPLQALHHLHPPQHLQHSQHLVPQALPPPYSSGAGNNELYSPQGQIDTLDRSFSEGTFSEALAPNSAAIPLDQTLQHLQMHHLPPHDRSLPTPILKHSPGAQITQPDHLQMHLSPSQAHVHFERNENLPFPDIASGGSPSEASMRMNSIPQPPSELGGLGNDATPLQTNIRSGPPPTHISSPPTENGSVSPAQSHSQHHPHPHPPVNLSPQTGSIEQSRPPTVMPEQGMGQSNLTPPSDFSQGQPRESPLTAETSGQPPGAASKPSDSLSGPIDLSQQSQSTP